MLICDESSPSTSITLPYSNLNGMLLPIPSYILYIECAFVYNEDIGEDTLKCITLS